MNPWDNLLLALKFAWPAYLFAGATIIAIEAYLHSLKTRPYEANEDFTDEQYEDGFYLLKERKQQ